MRHRTVQSGPVPQSPSRCAPVLLCPACRRAVARTERTLSAIDHSGRTTPARRRFLDVMAEHMTAALERNCREFAIPLWPPGDDNQGIVHVIGPELGLTQPGITIACGDSHTSTHGAVGAIAFGIGTSQVRDVRAWQCLTVGPSKGWRLGVTRTRK